ncbi:MAG: SpoIIIAH-like family protein [Clostridia bacterium]|nr:SpoIIIAH-like family protein [Clostridia bacterium]
MKMFANKKFISFVMVAVLLFAGFVNRNYKKPEDNQTAKILGEAAYVNNNIKIQESDELKSARNLREKSRDQTSEMLREIIDNPSTTDEGRKSAEQAFIELAKSIKNEADCEAILNQKGFNNVVVTITENSANVSIETKDLMNTEIAQITETVSTITGFESEKIKILSSD